MTSKKEDAAKKPFDVLGLALIGLPMLLACLVYVRLFGAELVWDDSIVHFRQMPFITTIGDAFFPPRSAIGMGSLYYRPFIFLTYMFDHKLTALFGKTDPAFFLHASNVVMHAITTGLVYVLALKILPEHNLKKYAAFFASLFFAVHPIHVESLSMVAGRTDILATLFLVSAMISTTYYARDGKIKYAVIVGVFFLLGLFCKENTAMGVALIPLLYLMVKPKDEPETTKPSKKQSPKAAPKSPLASLFDEKALMLLAVIGIASIVYLVLRIKGAGNLPKTPSQMSDSVLYDLFSALGYYIYKAIWAWPHNHYQATTPNIALTGLSILLAGFGVWWIVAKKPQNRNFLLFMAIWFFLTIIPPITIAPQGMLPTITAERYLYLPSVAVALLAGWGLMLLAGKNKNAAIALGVLVVGVYSVDSYSQTGAWITEVAFWQAAVESPGNENNGEIIGNLGVSYRRIGNPEVAVDYHLRARDAGFKRFELKTLNLINLSAGYTGRANQKFAAGDYKGAIEDCDTALSVLPSELDALKVDPIFYDFRGSAYLVKAWATERLKGAPDKDLLMLAYNDLEKAVRMNPGNPSVASNYNVCVQTLRAAGMISDTPPAQ